MVLSTRLTIYPCSTSLSTFCDLSTFLHSYKVLLQGPTFVLITECNVKHPIYSLLAFVVLHGYDKEGNKQEEGKMMSLGFFHWLFDLQKDARGITRDYANIAWMNKRYTLPRIYIVTACHLV